MPSYPRTRRTSARIAQATSNATNNSLPSINSEDTYENDQSHTAGVRRSSRGPKAAMGGSNIEISIPVNKASSSGQSSPVSTGGASGEGTNGYDTPATNVTTTPADSVSNNKVPKRVSASARARELRSSTFSLQHAARSLKRNAASLDEDSAMESSDAALARALQLEEYQAPDTKRRKTSRSKGRSDFEIMDSEDEGVSIDSEPLARSSRGKRFAQTQVIRDSEDSSLSDLDDIAARLGTDPEDELEDAYEDSSGEINDESSASTDDEVPLASRTLGSRRPAARQVRARRSRTAAGSQQTSAPSWMGRRVRDNMRLRVACTSNTGIGFEGT